MPLFILCATVSHDYTSNNVILFANTVFYEVSSCLGVLIIIFQRP
jgi:hypothetical protein